MHVKDIFLGDVFTFSTQTKGKKRIPYGTAGDCYSQRSGCPQGRFSIDLTGTSFKIAKGVRWRSHGYFSSVQVNMGVSKSKTIKYIIYLTQVVFRKDE